MTDPDASMKPSKCTVLLAILLAATFVGGCSGSKSSGSSPGETAGSTSVTEPTDPTVADDPTTTLPPGAVAGLDDYDGDGQLDPTCRTQDFGAGLVLRVPCQVISANEPQQGSTLVPGSLFALPGSTDIDLQGISGSLVLARDAAGAKVVIVVFNTDALFETGSADIGSTDTLDGTIRLVNSLYPGSALQVRGHTDSTGSATANQTLSENRAGSVRLYLQSHGVNAASVASVGLASTQPLAEERNPDGSDNAEGMQFNRRVEIVIRLP